MLRDDTGGRQPIIARAVGSWIIKQSALVSLWRDLREPKLKTEPGLYYGTKLLR